MGNSIYLGGGIKSAFCGGNVKEIWQGTNKLFPSGGGGDPMPEGFVKCSSIEAISYSNISFASGINFEGINANDIIEVEGVFKSESNGSGWTISLEPMVLYTNSLVEFVFTRFKGYGMEILYNGITINPSRWIPYDVGTKVDFYMKKDEYIELDFNGLFYKSSSKPSSSGSCYFNTLFANIGGDAKGSEIKNIKFTDKETGIVKLNLVPAKRTSDNSPAFIDVVSQKVIIGNSAHFMANE